mgnify:FL=1
MLLNWVHNLKNGLEEDVFYQIIAQTVEMTKRIEMNGLYLHNLMLQPELVYISERTKELFFVYQPIISRTTSGNVYAFLGDITQLAIKNSKEEKEFLKAFEKFLNDTQNYKIEDIEKYIRKMYPQVFRKIVTADAGKSGFITNDRASYENHYHREEDEEGTTLLVEGDEGGTTLLVEDEEEGTTLLQQEAFPIFERKNTGESVEINKNIFTIGKENESDFIVSNNKAISRRHAVIEKINGNYYLTDKKSTNHTYLNGEILEPERAYVLSDNDNIRIADEEFIFFLN